MAEARSRDNWARTSAVLALIATAHRDPKKHPAPFRPADFDPWARVDRRKRAIPVTDIRQLKAAFTGGRGLNGKERS